MRRGGEGGRGGVCVKRRGVEFAVGGIGVRRGGVGTHHEEHQLVHHEGGPARDGEVPKGEHARGGHVAPTGV